jgi:hypothetical protein
MTRKAVSGEARSAEGKGGERPGKVRPDGKGPRGPVRDPAGRGYFFFAFFSLTASKPMSSM